MSGRRRAAEWNPPGEGELAMLAEQLAGSIKAGEDLLGEGYDNGKWNGWVVETKHLIGEALGPDEWPGEFEQATGGTSFAVVGDPYDGYGDEDAGMLEARNEDVHAKLGVARAALRAIAQKLERSGVQPRASGLPKREFTFMRSEPLRAIAERDYEELRTVATTTLKATALLAGSVIEAAVLDALLRCGFNEKQLDRMEFNQLIEEASGAGILQKRTRGAAHAVRDVRNFVHPSVELREGRLRKVDADTAITIMNQILEDLTTK